ncbi:MAG: WYL domain-containing protein [Bacteroidetes Order II. Incertae sedis bacterium]|nr:WYL domain-containing protein [Bacteroidetes Order II. bacterium]
MSDFEQTKRFIIQEENLSRQDLIGLVGCSPRQLDRYLNDLLKQGMINKVKKGKQVFYVLNADKREPSLSLIRATKNEQLVLLMALNAARQQLMRTPLAKDINRLLAALNQQMELDADTKTEIHEDLAHFRFGDPPLENMRPEVFFAVHKAKKEYKTLTIAYQTGRSGQVSQDRKVDPVMIDLPSWTFVAWCHQRKKYLDFKFSRVLHVEPEMEDAQIRAFDPDLHYKDRFSQLAGNTRYTLTIQALKEVATYFKTKKYHASQEVLAENEDGSLIVRFLVTNDDEVAAFLRSWGAKIKVIQPKKMQIRLLEEAKSVMESYER